MQYRIHKILGSITVMASLLLAACGGGATAPDNGGAAAPPEPGSTDGGVTIRYALWDANQQPAYEACAASFHEQNPNITVKIEQVGWDDYWSNIQTGMVGGTAPDVFTNHLAKYPEFASKGQLVDIQTLVERDGVDTSQYIGRLADLWQREDKRYGLPKDWDTIAIVYNKDMFQQAGIDEASLNDLTWNPQDGGSFGELIKKLTLDANGNNALSSDFDKSNVVQYGFIPQGAGDAYGQTEWSMFAVSNGWQFNEGPWATSYNYGDPKFVETIQWYANLNLEEGIAPPLADIESLEANTLFSSGKGAMTTDGSWMIGQYIKDAIFPIGFALLPQGPEGRKSMFNGLADSIWTGSSQQEEAWQWVQFAASPECQNIVGSFGVVFPAIQTGVDAALQAYQERGVDVTAFTEQALDPDVTFLFPIADHASEIVAIMEPVMDSIMLGQATAADALPLANQEVNTLFQ
ncbi:MAG: extracellular solute-binding protein [Chloroflexales bacterium]|nr:extracellular solute-binding protein [Chloroflexales bacterium]